MIKENEEIEQKGSEITEWMEECYNLEEKLRLQNLSKDLRMI